MKHQEKKSFLHSKTLRNGAYAGALCAIALAVAVAVNLFAGAIPTQYTSFDMTDAKLYSLSDETRQVAGSLTQDVTLYYLVQAQSEDANITRLLAQYDALDHVQVVRKDPVVYPTFAASYDAASASVGSVVRMRAPSASAATVVVAVLVFKSPDAMTPVAKYKLSLAVVERSAPMR